MSGSFSFVLYHTNFVQLCPGMPRYGQVMLYYAKIWKSYVKISKSTKERCHAEFLKGHNLWTRPLIAGVNECFYLTTSIQWSKDDSPPTPQHPNTHTIGNRFENRFLTLFCTLWTTRLLLEPFLKLAYIKKWQKINFLISWHVIYH